MSDGIVEEWLNDAEREIALLKQKLAAALERESQLQKFIQGLNRKLDDVFTHRCAFCEATVTEETAERQTEFEQRIRGDERVKLTEALFAAHVGSNARITLFGKVIPAAALEYRIRNEVWNEAVETCAREVRKLKRSTSEPVSKMNPEGSEP